MPPLNTNVFPWFDDFNEAKKYYDILFEPAIPVQPRELNQIQSIQHDQRKKFADHIFKEGAVVRGGQIKIDTNYAFIKVLAPNGSPLESETYRSTNFYGRTIVGTSGIRAVVLNSLPPASNQVTFYVKYSSGDTSSGSNFVFANNEVITLLDPSGSPTAITITMAASSSSGLGSAANIKSGIFYARGKFLISDDQTLILDQFTNAPSYRVGFNIVESAIDSDDDPSLNDNSSGTENFNSPGANRREIELILSKLDLATQGTEDFLELAEVTSGVLTKNTIAVTQYSDIMNTIARRDNDVHGDYTITPPKVDVREFYDSGTNKGIYDPTDFGFTTQAEAKQVSIDRFGVSSPGTAHQVDTTWYPGSSPTDLINLMKAKIALGVDPFKAYVNGFEIQLLARQYVDVNKARTFDVANNATIKTRIGNYVRITNLYGAIDFRDFVTVNLYDRFTSTRGAAAASGTIIGTARVRGLDFESGTPGTNTSVYQLFLFDIQMNAGKTFTNVRQIQATGFTCDVLTYKIPLNGSISWNHTSLALTGVGTGWFTVDSQLLQAGDYIFAEGSQVFLRIPSPSGITSNLTIAGVAALGVALNNGFNSDISGEAFSYVFANLEEAQNSILVFPMPQTAIKTVTADGITIDTNYNIRRYFDPQTVNGSGQIQVLTSSADETFLPFSNFDWFAVYTAGAHAGTVVGLASGDLTYNGTNTQVTIGGLFPTESVAVVATIRKAQGTASACKTKSLVTGATTTVTTAAGINKVSLGKADIIRINSIYMSPDFSTPATTSHTNITSWYDLDNGQRDEFYDLGSIVLKTGYSLPTGRLLINFDYFTHGVNGNYFSVDTYTVISGIEYEDIPQYSSDGIGFTYSLRDCLDFRPRIKDDASGFANTGGGSLVDLPRSGAVFADFQYYLNRIDKLSLTPTGDLQVVEGNDSLDPSPPADPSVGMVTHQLNVRAYTFNTSDVVVDFFDNKRYTMADIRKLEKRIENVEYYTSLNLLEKDTQDLKIPDADGNDRFKNGFIVDPFNGHRVGDTLAQEYRCSMDIAQGIMRPMYWSENVSLIESVSDDISRASAHYKKTGQHISLPYTEVNCISQPVATGIINVNPFNVVNFIGDIKLNPDTDQWKDTEQIPDLTVPGSGDYDAVVSVANGIGTIWNEWQTHWTGTPTTVTDTPVVTRELSPTPMLHQTATGGVDSTGRRAGQVSKPGKDTWPKRSVTTVRSTTSVDVNQTRSGIKAVVVPKTVTTNLGDKVVSTAFEPYIRSKDVQFQAKGFMPNSRLYAFFDGVDVGDNVHKWASPLTPEAFNPGDVISTGTHLVTDATGKVSGTFRIPAGEFKTGTRVFLLTSDSKGSTKDVDSYGNSNYQAIGLLETHQDTILSTTDAEISWQNVTDSRTVTDTSVSTTVTLGPWVDPVAESFMVLKKGGTFLTSVNLYFAAKDNNIPVMIEIREMINGYPGLTVLPFSRVVKDASSVTVSTDASAATNFQFADGLVYAKQGVEYALVVMANTNNYKLYISHMGDDKVGTEIPVTDQPYDGSLFESQNASTWTAVQEKDLKFDINCAEFDITDVGSPIFVNAVLPAAQLEADPFLTKNGSSKVRVIHPNHGLRTDGAKTSKVTLAGCVTFNGIAAGALNGTHDVLSFDIDSYVIDTGDAADTTGRGGGTTITATENVQMDVLQPVMTSIVLADTSIDLSMKTTSSKSVNPASTDPDMYVTEGSYTPVTANNNFEFSRPRLVASQINETNLLSGNKSFFLKGILASDNENVSPIIDIQRLSITCVSNRIDNPSYTGTNSVNDSTLDINSLVTAGIISFSAATGTLTTTDATTASAISSIVAGKYITIVADKSASGILTSDATNVSNADTVTIASKVYTFQTSLTNVDGNVKIGVDAATSLSNLVAAITLGAGSGTAYAAAMTLHPTVSASVGSATTVNAWAKTGGTAGNSIATTETSTHLSWGGATLSGGAAGTISGTYRVISSAYTPSLSPLMTVVIDAVLTDVPNGTANISQLRRFFDERAPIDGSASAKYACKRMVLAQPSNGLKVIFAAYKSSSSQIVLYYKIGKTDDNSEFDTLNWNVATIDATPGDASNPSDFRDYSYTINDLPDFTSVASKIVSLGSNSSDVPKFKDFRMIALAT